MLYPDGSEIVTGIRNFYQEKTLQVVETKSMDQKTMCVGSLTVQFEKKETKMGQELGRNIFLDRSFVYIQDTASCTEIIRTVGLYLSQSIQCLFTYGQPPNNQRQHQPLIPLFSLFQAPVLVNTLIPMIIIFKNLISYGILIVQGLFNLDLSVKICGWWWFCRYRPPYYVYFFQLIFSHPFRITKPLRAEACSCRQRDSDGNPYS